MNSPPPFQQLAILDGSPAGTFRAWVAAELAEGTIPHACPHPVTADRLLLPAWTLLCADCYDQGRSDATPGPCASCEAPGASDWTWWLDVDSHVFVVARICVPCGTDGTVPVSLN